MSLWESIKDVGKDIVGGIGGAVVDVAGSFLGNELIGKPNAKDAYKQSRKASAEAFERSYGVYKTRYQDTMADMAAAGLNPILAAGSGGFTASGQPQMQAAQGYQAHNPQMNFANSARNLSDVQLKTAQKEETKKKIQLLRAKTLTELENIAKVKAEARNQYAQSRLAWNKFWVEYQKQSEVKSRKEVNIAQKQLLLQRAKILKAQLINFQKAAKVYNTPYIGQFLKWIETLIKTIIPISINLKGTM